MPDKRTKALRKTILVSLLVCSLLFAKGQSTPTILDFKLDGTEKGQSLSTVFTSIQKKTAARFYFLPEWIESISFQDSDEPNTLGDALDKLFTGTSLSFFTMYPNTLVIIKDPKQAFLRKNAIEAAHQQQKKIEPRLLGTATNPKKGKVIVSGRVMDLKTGKPLPRTNIQILDTQEGTTTDEVGQFTLSLDPGPHVLEFSFVNFEDKVLDLLAYADGEINLNMEESPILLDEIIVQDHSTQEIATSRIGQIKFTIKEIKRAPALLGEVDLVKQVQVLPGVTTVGEAATGFNVRGGSVDQNLILYDGMPVFNSSHVFGFFSAFNSEAIRDVSFYRGGIPAEYGGRASSVLDIKSKDGDYKKWNGNAGLGMITSNLMINGPIRKDKTALAASFRSTYSNWLVHSIRTDYADLSQSSVFFYDGTLKLTHLFNENTKLSITGYSSKDAFRLMGDSTYRWSNLQLSAKLDHQFSSKFSSELSAGTSSYGYRIENADPMTASELSYRITTSMVKANFHYQEENHKINFGWQFLFYQFNPGMLKPGSPASNAKSISLDKQYSIENAYYIADEWAISERLTLESGIRLPMFTSLGRASVNIYRTDTPIETGNVTDTIHIKPGRPIKTYYGAEPRLSFRWMASPSSSLKLRYNRMYQYLHLVTNTTAVTPVDIWQPSGYYFRPQRADQVSLGYFKDFNEKKYGASAEVFYKAIHNVVDFKDGAQLILNRHLETALLQGKGKAYGIETSLSKNSGRFTTMLNYTFSRAFRTIAALTSAESVNRGQQYPASFDQPHIINISWKFNLTKRHFFTGNFTYHSGRPVTIPLSAFQLENTSVAYFSARNQYRIPDYHRLDLALVIEGNHKRKKWAEGTWVFSVYNVYARKNPYTVFFKSSGAGIPRPYQLSIVGTLFPSVSYNVKF